MKSGIYQIKNLVNNKIYIGSSKNIKQRWNRHKNDLKNNKHDNVYLQREWNKYGEGNFQFSVIENIDFNELIEREQYYIDTLLPFKDNGYNIGKLACGGDNLTLNPKRNEIIKKMTNSVKKRWNEATDEYKEKIRENLLADKNPNWKGGRSITYCSCGTKKANNAQTCRNCYDVRGEKNPFYGKKVSDDNKKYLSNLFKGKNLSGRGEIIIIDGIEYNSYKDAERKLNINWGVIRWRVLNTKPKWKNYYIKNSETILSDDKYSHRPIIIDGIEYQTKAEASKKLNIKKNTIAWRLNSNNEKFKNYKYK